MHRRRARLGKPLNIFEDMGQLGEDAAVVLPPGNVLQFAQQFYQRGDGSAHLTRVLQAAPIMTLLFLVDKPGQRLIDPLSAVAIKCHSANDVADARHQMSRIFFGRESQGRRGGDHDAASWLAGPTETQSAPTTPW